MPNYTKQCRICNIVKDIRLFYEGRRICQECYRLKQTSYYEKNQERIKERVLARYHAQKK